MCYQYCFVIDWNRSSNHIKLTYFIWCFPLTPSSDSSRALETSHTGSFISLMTSEEIVCWSNWFFSELTRDGGQSERFLSKEEKLQILMKYGLRVGYTQDFWSWMILLSYQTCVMCIFLSVCTCNSPPRDREFVHAWPGTRTKWCTVRSWSEE